MTLRSITRHAAGAAYFYAVQVHAAVIMPRAAGKVHRVRCSTWRPLFAREIPLSVSVEIGGRGYSFSVRREGRDS